MKLTRFCQRRQKEIDNPFLKDCSKISRLRNRCKIAAIRVGVQKEFGAERELRTF